MSSPPQHADVEAGERQPPPTAEEQATEEKQETPQPQEAEDKPASQKAVGGGYERPSSPTNEYQPIQEHANEGLERRPLLQTSEYESAGFTQLRAGTYDIVWVVSFRVITIFILTSCLAFGAKKQVFGLKDQNFKFFSLSADFQLVLFGLVNKVLDYLVQDALFHIGGVTLTTWMAFTKIGARTLDLHMQDELTKPWVTVMNFVQRFQLFGWQGVGILGLLRYLGSFATAMSVLLLGASVNTIGIPKERWAAGVDLWTDRYLINSIRWNGVVNLAYNMDFSLDGIQNRVRSIIASECWLSTSGLWLATNKDGWIEIYQDRNGVWNDTSQTRTNVQKMTGVRVDGAVVSSLSAQGNAVYDMWKSQSVDGTSNARNSLGWTGVFNLTLPIGMVSCAENTTDSGNGTITVTGPTIHGPPAITVVFGNLTERSFPGATCTFTLRQGQYGLRSWIVSEGRPDISIDNYGTDRYMNITPHESPEENRNILSQLADAFREVIPIMDNLSSPGGLVRHMLSVRDNLLKIGLSNPDSTAGLSLVVAGMLQHLITMAEWELVKVDPGKDLVRSTGVRYQVYGSGPRLAWQWAVAAVIVITLLLLIYDLFITLRQRINVGLWLSLPGMMVAANYADKMPSINDAFGAESETVQKTTYFIRKLSSGSSQLTDNPDSGTILSTNDWFGGERHPTRE